MKYWENKTLDALSGEEFKDITGYWGIYSVSNYGRVKSERREVRCAHGCTRFVKERILSQKIEKRGLCTVNLSSENIKETKLVSHLVYEAFVGERKEGYYVVHKNKIEYDNRLENLTLMTFNENAEYETSLGVRDDRIKIMRTFNPSVSEIYKNKYGIIKDGKLVYKLCRKCNTIKPVEDFYNFSHRNTYECGECNLRYTQKVKNINKIKIAREKEKEGLKKCSKCKQFKPFNDFHKSKNCYLGLSSVCKQCRKEHNYEKKQPTANCDRYRT